MGQDTKRHMMMPTSPTAHFILPHTQVLFALLKAGFNWPSHTAETRQRLKRGGGWGIAQIGLQFPRIKLASQYQPAVRTRQAVTHRHHVHGPKVGHHRSFAPLFDQVSLPLIGVHTRRHAGDSFSLVLPVAKALSSGLATSARPLGNCAQGTFEPYARVMRHFSKVPKPTTRHAVEKHAVAAKSFITHYPARPQLLRIDHLAHHFPAQLGFGLEV